MQQRLNTTLKRSSYQSIPEEDDDTSTGSSPLSTASASNSIAETLPKRQLRPYFLGAILLCLSGLIAVSIIHDDYYTLYMPTARERDVASAYDLPASLSTWNRIQKAQRLADISQSWHTNNDKKNDNNDNAEDHEDVVQKINKKNGKDYVDVPDGCEATVMIVRHCEKGDIREHCDYLGFERSVYLAKQFGNSHEERWPAPSFIFAMSPGGRHNKHKMNYREIETVGPLAEKTGITVDDSYDSHSIHHLTREILTYLHTGNMCGKLTVISWKHSEIPHLAHRLGCGPYQGCPLDYHGKSFDQVWQIRFVHRQFEHSSHKNLRLDKHPAWRIFGSVQNQNFDPLAVSKTFGDYPSGGTSTGGRWQKVDTSIPERKEVKDTRGWKSTRVGFTDEPEQ